MNNPYATPKAPVADPDRPDARGVRYAGFWIRFLASVIDSILTMVIVAPILYWLYGKDYFLVAVGLSKADSMFAGPADPLLNYVQDLVAATRSGRWFLQGLSPRAGIALVRAAKAQALLSGRDYVAPDDVQAILPQTIAHRLVPVGDAGRGPLEQVRAMLEAVPLP